MNSTSRHSTPFVIRKFLSGLILVSFLIITNASCSGDSDGDLSSPLQEKIFDDKNGLKLTYNGSPMIGKQAKVVPSQDRAMITLSSEFNLSSLGMAGLTGKISGAGVLPGSQVTELPVELQRVGSRYLFSGKGNSDYASFTYSGVLSDTGLQLNLSNVSLKGGTITPEVWVPSEKIVLSDGKIIKGPLLADWEYEPLPEIDINFSQILQEFLSLPLISQSSGSRLSINETILASIRAIALSADGNMVVTYMTDAFGTPQITTTLPNRFQYIVTPNGEIRIFSDPMSVIGLALVNFSGSIPANWVQIKNGAMMPTSEAKEEGLKLPDWADALIPPIVTALCQAMGEGIPLLYAPTPDGLELFLDSELVSQALSRLLTVVSSSPEIKETLSQLMAQHPKLEPFAPQLDQILAAMPIILERTNKLKIGIILSPKSK